MIERVNPPAIKLQVGKLPFTSPVFNFPHASLLTFSYRIKPVTNIFTNTEFLLSGVELAFGVGSPPDLGTGSEQRETLPLAPQFVPRARWQLEFEEAEAARKEVNYELENAGFEVESVKADVKAAERAVTAAKTKLGTPGLAGSGLLQQLAFAAEAYAKGTEAERLTNLGKEVSEAQAAIREQEAEIAKAEEGVTKAKEAVAKAEAAEEKVRKFTLEKAFAAIRRIEEEEPTAWTPLVIGSITRAFDALRFTAAISHPSPAFLSQFFELEYTIEISRPEDLGPTFTEPFANARGR